MSSSDDRPPVETSKSASEARPSRVVAREESSLCNWSFPAGGAEEREWRREREEAREARRGSERGLERRREGRVDRRRVQEAAMDGHFRRRREVAGGEGRVERRERQRWWSSCSSPVGEGEGWSGDFITKGKSEFLGKREREAAPSTKDRDLTKVF